MALFFGYNWNVQSGALHKCLFQNMEHRDSWVVLVTLAIKSAFLICRVLAPWDSCSCDTPEGFWLCAFFGGARRVILNALHILLRRLLCSSAFCHFFLRRSFFMCAIKTWVSWGMRFLVNLCLFHRPFGQRERESGAKKMQCQWPFS